MHRPLVRALSAAAVIATIAIAVWFQSRHASRAGGAPLDKAKPAVASSLAEDARIGSVIDVQGVVVLRPMLAERWTPICREVLLKPGDWLRTDLRGANAVRVRFVSDAQLTPGFRHAP